MNTQEYDRSGSSAAGEPLGVQLRRAREQAGLSVPEVGSRLRLPAAIIEAMEREDFQRLGATIYARSHLGGYARLLGLPPGLVDQALAGIAPPAPPLVSANRVPRSHYLLDRYARRAVYVVLTASIVLPVVWLATRDQLPGRSTVVSSLESAPAQIAPQGAAGTAVQAAVEPRRPSSVEERQVLASLAPFYREADPVVAPPLQAPVAPAPDSTLAIDFVGPSWVEVVARDGKRLAFGLVAAGEQQRFPIKEVASVSIGDAEAVEVNFGGEALDLAPFRRAKVARFTLSSDGELNPAN